MEPLDVRVGRDVMRDLCPGCVAHLQGVLRKTDLVLATTPYGWKRLVDKISRNTCAECQKIIVLHATGGRG